MAVAGLEPAECPYVGNIRHEDRNWRADCAAIAAPCAHPWVAVNEGVPNHRQCLHFVMQNKVEKRRQNRGDDLAPDRAGE